MSALELKARNVATTRILIREWDLSAIEAQLRELAQQMPQLVQGMPVVLDSEQPIDLYPVLQKIRAIGMQPLGVLDGLLAPTAKRMGLPVLSRGRSEEDPLARSQTLPPPEPPKPVGSTTRFVQETIRSGQQVYAEGGDLVVLGSVSAGAEAIADGCVHIMGTLRGRAMAGVRGDTQARVFCRVFDAELVAIAGIYAVSDQMQSGPLKKPAQAFLAQNRLVIEPLP
jgi:septum site-determining protein MinC